MRQALTGSRELGNVRWYPRRPDRRVAQWKSAALTQRRSAVQDRPRLPSLPPNRGCALVSNEIEKRRGHLVTEVLGGGPPARPHQFVSASLDDEQRPPRRDRAHGGAHGLDRTEGIARAVHEEDGCA